MSHPILILSSFLFSSVAIHAYHINNNYSILYSAVTILSLIVHSTGNLKSVDRLAAHTAFLATAFDILLNSWPKYASTIKYLGLVASLWVLQGPFPKYSTFLHFALHISSIIGMHFHLSIQ
jgi:hypothetical protein